jgi:acetyl esterase
VTAFRLWDPALDELAEEQRQHNVGLMELTAAMSAIDNSTPEGIRWIREAMAPGGAFGMQALDHGVDRVVDGIPVRVTMPPGDDVRGVYLHFHGGAMTVGSALAGDIRNWAWAQALSCAVVSVDYRLAPEHPFPAGVDDCFAAARWLAASSVEEFGTDRLVLGGESAGAYFAMTTALRMRDAGLGSAFLAMDLCYGPYDMSGTPSVKLQIGKVPYASDSSAQKRMFLGDRTTEELRDPAVSPMWADLHDLPPAILTVGTADWLLDESILLAGRLAAAGNEVDLNVLPEGPHGIEMMPTALGREAQRRIFAFLNGVLGT